MRRIRLLLVAFVAVGLLAGPIGSPAQAAADSAGISASAKAKKKCKKFKGKKKRKCLKRVSKGGKKPWVGSPYKPKMTCSMSPEMQREYAKYGLTCIDLGLGVTTLIEL